MASWAQLLNELVVLGCSGLWWVGEGVGYSVAGCGEDMVVGKYGAVGSGGLWCSGLSWIVVQWVVVGI